MGFLIGGFLIAWGFYLTFKVGQANREMRKYEFEHRTDGGVVQFKNFEDAEKHEQKKKNKDSMFVFAQVILLIGIFIFCFSFMK